MVCEYPLTLTLSHKGRGNMRRCPPCTLWKFVLLLQHEREREYAMSTMHPISCIPCTTLSFLYHSIVFSRINQGGVTPPLLTFPTPAPCSTISAPLSVFNSPITDHCSPITDHHFQLTPHRSLISAPLPSVSLPITNLLQYHVNLQSSDET